MSDRDFIDVQGVANSEPTAVDWVNLPKGTHAITLWDCLHDAEVTSVRSRLLERTIDLSCDIEHLRSFHQFDEGLQFILQLEGVESARVIRYGIWPGGCAIPAGVSRDDERKLIAEYQARWREESAAWNEFEPRAHSGNEGPFIISNAALVTSKDGPVALRLCGQLIHALDNGYAKYHEISVRAERLKVSGSDGKELGLQAFQRLGETYWEERSRRAQSTKLK